MAVLLLVGVTLVWGTTFLVIQDSTRRMPTLDFVAARFAVGALVLIAMRPRVVVSLDRSGWARGAALGLALGVSYYLQTLGLQYMRATVSAFVTCMFVVFTPLLAALVLRQRISSTAWVGTVLAVVGLGLLTLQGFGVGFGELLTLGCALFIALQILGTGAWSAGRDPFGLAFAQMVTVAVVASAVSLPDGLELVPPDPAAWFGVMWTAVLATAAALVIQTWAQTRISTARVAVIMTLEPVFAAAFGVFYGQFLNAQQVVGGVLILAAMLVVELHSAKQERGGQPRDATRFGGAMRRLGRRLVPSTQRVR
ncbi:DMT family transporter [Streptomyces zaomyceticus]|uniref:DMT family transporter n=1 Tax=Streptomyces zaomyceticus TaxID=68286 RepID=UPI0036C8FA65